LAVSNNAVFIAVFIKFILSQWLYLVKLFIYRSFDNPRHNGGMHRVTPPFLKPALTLINALTSAYRSQGIYI